MTLEDFWITPIRKIRALSVSFVGQSGILFGSRIFSMMLGFITAPLITNALGAAEYGRMAFAIGVVTWLNLLFTFGLDSAPKMLANLNDDQEQRRLVGGFFVIVGMMGLLFSATVAILSTFIDHYFKVVSGPILLMVAAGVWALPMQLLVEWMLYGLQRSMILSLVVILPRLVYLCAVLMLVQSGVANAGNLYLAHVISTMTVFIIGVSYLHPRLDGLSRSLHSIWQDLQSFGRYAYIGRVPAVLVYHVDKLLLGWFTDARQIGFYSLALTLSAPVALIGNSVSQVVYKDLAAAKSIPRSVILLTFLSGCVAALGVAIVGTLAIRYLFPAEFKETIFYLAFLCIATSFQTFYAPFNSFISAKGHGRILRKMGWTYSAGAIFFDAGLIPLLGVIGAVIGTILSNAVWLVQCIWYYRRIIMGVYYSDKPKEDTS